MRRSGLGKIEARALDRTRPILGGVLTDHKVGRARDDSTRARQRARAGEVADDLGIRGEVEGCASIHDQSIHGRGGDGGRDTRSSTEAVENCVVRRTRVELQRAEVQARGAEVAISRSGPENEGTVAGLSEAAGAGVERTANRGIHRQGGRTDGVDDDFTGQRGSGGRVAARARTADGGRADATSSRTDRGVDGGKDATAIESYVTERVEGQATRVINGQGVDCRGSQRGSRRPRGHASEVDPVVVGGNNRAARHRGAHFRGGVQRAKADRSTCGIEHAEAGAATTNGGVHDDHGGDGTGHVGISHNTTDDDGASSGGCGCGYCRGQGSHDEVRGRRSLGGA